MKNILSTYHNWLKRYRYKKRCRLYYRFYCKLFWIYVKKTDSAAQAVAEVRRAMSWFEGLEKEYKDYI